jgi:hypothetical protein
MAGLRARWRVAPPKRAADRFALRRLHGAGRFWPAPLWRSVAAHLIALNLNGGSGLCIRAGNDDKVLALRADVVLHDLADRPDCINDRRAGRVGDEGVRQLAGLDHQATGRSSRPFCPPGIASKLTHVLGLRPIAQHSLCICAQFSRPDAILAQESTTERGLRLITDLHRDAFQ